MQLRQAKPFGVLDHHHRRVRNIDTHFDDGRRYQDADAAVSKRAHHFVSFGASHATMYQANAKLLKHRLAHLLGHLRRVSNVLQLLGGLHQRIDNKRLMAAAQLVQNHVVNRLSLRFGKELGFYRQTSWRHFVENRNLHIAVEHHRQTAGNRRCAHQQHVRLSREGNRIIGVAGYVLQEPVAAPPRNDAVRR